MLVSSYFSSIGGELDSIFSLEKLVESKNLLTNGWWKTRYKNRRCLSMRDQSSWRFRCNCYLMSCGLKSKIYRKQFWNPNLLEANSKFGNFRKAYILRSFIEMWHKMAEVSKRTILAFIWNAFYLIKTLIWF